MLEPVWGRTGLFWLPLLGRLRLGGGQERWAGVCHGFLLVSAEQSVGGTSHTHGAAAASSSRGEELGPLNSFFQREQAPRRQEEKPLVPLLGMMEWRQLAAIPAPISPHTLSSRGLAEIEGKQSKNLSNHM